MHVVIDTDILSAFCKIDKLELLGRLFHNSRILISPSVHKEIKIAATNGKLDYRPLPTFSRVTLTRPERKMARDMWVKKRLGLGDCECLAIAYERKCALLTNDRQTQSAAESLSVDYMSLPLMLRELYVTGISSRDQIRDLVGQIERKDNVRIKNLKSLLD